MEIGFPIKEDDVKQKGLKGSDAFRVVDNYFSWNLEWVQYGI